MFNLFLDDEREVKEVVWTVLPDNFYLEEETTIVRTFKCFKDFVLKNIKTQEDVDKLSISFDHDLNLLINKNHLQSILKFKNLFLAQQFDDEFNQLDKFLMDLKIHKKLGYHSIEEMLDEIEEDLKYSKNNSDVNEFTGDSCLTWLFDYLLDKNFKLNVKHLQQIKFHTMNNVGKDNMESKLINFVKHCLK